jgi:hypothetical protein
VSLQVEKAVNDCKLVFMRTFDGELSRNPYYKGLYWVPGLSESDGARVIRVGLGYRRNTSIDALLKQAKIPYSTTDIFPDVSGELTANVHFLDIVNSSPSVTIDGLLSLKASLNVEMRRETLIKLCKRLAMALSAGVARRTVVETVAAQQQAADDAAKRGAGGGDDESTAGGVDLTTVFVDRWQHLRGIFPACVDFFKKAYTWLTGTDTVITSFQYKKPSDLLNAMGLNDPWWKQNLPSSMASEPGAVPKIFFDVSKRLKASIQERFNAVQSTLDAAVAKEEKKQHDLRLGITNKRKQPKQELDENGTPHTTHHYTMLVILRTCGRKMASYAPCLSSSARTDTPGMPPSHAPHTPHTPAGNPLVPESDSEEDEFDASGYDKDGFALGGAGRPMTADEGKKVRCGSRVGDPPPHPSLTLKLTFPTLNSQY